MKEQMSNYASLKNHMQTIKRRIKNYVLVLVSENKIILPDLINFEIEKLNDKDIKMYFVSLLNSLSFLKRF